MSTNQNLGITMTDPVDFFEAAKCTEVHTQNLKKSQLYCVQSED